jgi:hypothetical protein
MAQRIINIGAAANDGTGDPIRDAFTKANENFTELYASVDTIPTDISELADANNIIFSRDYSDLANTPFIPTDISDLTDANNVLGAAIPTDISDLADSTGLLFSGEYTDLANTPFIPVDISDLTDVGEVLTKIDVVNVRENFTAVSGVSSFHAQDCSDSHIVYFTAPTANFSINFFNIDLDQGKSTAFTVVVDQGNPAYVTQNISINAVPQVVYWQGGLEPTGTVNGIDVISLSVLNTASGYVVLGQSAGFEET